MLRLVGRENAPDPSTPSAGAVAGAPAVTAKTTAVPTTPSSTPIAPTTRTTAGVPDSPARRTARFRQTHLCYSAWNEIDFWDRAQDNCSSIAHYGADATTVASCQAGLEQARRQMQASRGELAGCPDAATVARRYYEAARDAALAGDADAQACYLLDFFDNPDRTPLILTAREIADYRQAAPRYLSDGLARGDWRTASLLAFHYVDGNTLLPLVASQKPIDQYVMKRLLQLGADGQYAHLLEMEIQAAFLSPGFDGRPRLTPREAAEGTARARALYHRYFEASPRLRAEPIACPPG